MLQPGEVAGSVMQLTAQQVGGGAGVLDDPDTQRRSAAVIPPSSTTVRKYSQCFSESGRRLMGNHRARRRSSVATS